MPSGQSTAAAYTAPKLSLHFDSAPFVSLSSATMSRDWAEHVAKKFVTPAGMHDLKKRLVNKLQEDKWEGERCKKEVDQPWVAKAKSRTWPRKSAPSWRSVKREPYLDNVPWRASVARASVCKCYPSDSESEEVHGFEGEGQEEDFEDEGEDEGYESERLEYEVDENPEAAGDDFEDGAPDESSEVPAPPGWHPKRVRKKPFRHIPYKEYLLNLQEAELAIKYDIPWQRRGPQPMDGEERPRVDQWRGQKWRSGSKRWGNKGGKFQAYYALKFGNGGWAEKNPEKAKGKKGKGGKGGKRTNPSEDIDWSWGSEL